MKDFTITLTGTRPLIMHNSRLVDKMDPLTQQIAVAASKRKRTDEDDLELSRLEWLGGLYFDDVVGPYLPGDNIFKCLVEAARRTRQGKQVEQGLFLTTEVNPLGYQGPRDVDGLWKDANYVFRKAVKVQQSRLIRTRPMFRSWVTQVEGKVDPNVLDPRDLEQIAASAGSYIGLGDWRPRYGLFTAQVTVR